LSAYLELDIEYTKKLWLLDVTSVMTQCAGIDGSFSTWTPRQLYEECVSQLPIKDKVRWQQLYREDQVFGARLRWTERRNNSLPQLKMYELN
jgi:hypothetical protein